MKKQITLALAFGHLLFFSLTATAAPEPLLTVTLKNHPTLISAISQVGEAGQPGTGDTIKGMLPAMLGTPTFAGIDENRPWQIAFWFKGPGANPVLAIYVPVTDFAAFKNGLSPDGLFGGENLSTITEKQKHAVIYDGDQTGLTDADREGVLNWTVPSASKVKNAVSIKIALDEPTRQIAVAGLQGAKAFAKMAATSSLDAAPKAQAINTEAFGEVFDLYFGLIESFVTGMGELRIDLDVANNEVLIAPSLAPVPDSSLAQWLAPNPNGIAKDIAHIDWNSGMAFAMSMQKSPAMSEFFQKIMPLSFKMQNIELDAATLEESKTIMDSMLPMVFSGSMDFTDKRMVMGGHYRFPGQDTKAAYDQLMTFMNSFLKAATGKDKIYSEFTLKRNQRKVGEITVDQATLTMNPDSPAMQIPGQKEQMELMFPGGKMAFEYGQAKDRVYIAMHQKIEDLLKLTATVPPGFKITPHTTFVAQLDILQLMKQSFLAVPNNSPLPEEILNNIDTKGTAIRLQTDQNGDLRGSVAVPLKLISTIGETARKAK